MSGAKLTGLVIVFTLTVAGLAALALGMMSFFDPGGPEDDRRPVLRQAGDALALGGDGVELLKALGGTACTAEEEGGERWVFRIREDKAADRAPGCVANPGDLVVWVKQRRIVAFEPVHQESEIVRDAAGYSRFQRRYTRAPVEEEKGPVELMIETME